MRGTRAATVAWENIFRAKSKLTLLTEQVTGGLGTGAKLIVVHRNEMGSLYKLVERHYFLDGMPLRQDVDLKGEKLTGEKELVIFDGPIVEGSHTLTVNMVYRGNGGGLFSYMNGFVFRLRDNYTFTCEQGKISTVIAAGYEKGDFTTEITDRPTLKFKTNVVADRKLDEKSPE